MKTKIGEIQISLDVEHNATKWGVDAELKNNEGSFLKDLKRVSDQADKVLLESFEADKLDDKEKYEKHNTDSK